MDKNIIKHKDFIKTTFPGEIIALDILEVKKKDLIIIAINYFSRYLFAKTIKSKEPKRITDFISKIAKEIPIMKIKTDNGREFINSTVKQWCNANNIVHITSIPYYHESNGRVERAIRTVRSALKRDGRPSKVALSKVIENYNETYHRGIGMSPIEARKTSNKNRVLENQFKYSKEYKNKNESWFNEGENVLIRNEIKLNKMSPEYIEGGVIYKKLGDKTYIVKKMNGKLIRKHQAQLKFDPRDVGYTNNNVSSSL